MMSETEYFALREFYPGNTYLRATDACASFSAWGPYFDQVSDALNLHLSPSGQTPAGTPTLRESLREMRVPMNVSGGAMSITVYAPQDVRYCPLCGGITLRRRRSEITKPNPRWGHLWSRVRGGPGEGQDFKHYLAELGSAAEALPTEPALLEKVCTTCVLRRKRKLGAQQARRNLKINREAFQRELNKRIRELRRQHLRTKADRSKRVFAFTDAATKINNETNNNTSK